MSSDERLTFMLLLGLLDRSTDDRIGFFLSYILGKLIDHSYRCDLTKESEMGSMLKGTAFPSGVD